MQIQIKGLIVKYLNLEDERKSLVYDEKLLKLWSLQ